MHQQLKTLRIALICNNLVRELATLKSVKKELEKQLNAEVKIIGSLAEIQRTYFSLYRFSPHVVFLSQLQEKCCRDIASYVKQSGGMVVVMPEEITPAKVVESLILNPDFTYNDLVDLVCLPGKVMEKFFKKTDITHSKIKITGAPKIDIERQEQGLSRTAFAARCNIDPKKKNVFIFTSFPQTGMEYFKTDECFTGNLPLIRKIQRVLKDTRQEYLENLPRICAELSDYTVILKPHPLEDMNIYKTISAPNLHLITGVSMVDCVRSIDVAIHWNSTVSTSCWLHGVPTLQYSPIKKHDWLLSGFTKGNPLLSDSKELVLQVKKYIAGKTSLPKKYLDAQQDYFRNNFFKVDGKSAQRIALLNKQVVDQREFELQYIQPVSSVWYLIEIIEKIVGVKTTRRLMTFLFPYNWRYATENYLP